MTTAAAVWPRCRGPAIDVCLCVPGGELVLAVLLKKLGKKWDRLAFGLLFFNNKYLQYN